MVSQKLVHFYTCALLTLLTFSFNVNATGRFLVKKGNVTLDGNSITRKSRFQAGQTLKVGPNSLAIIRFDNGNTVKVNENTSLKIEATVNKKSQTTVFNLLKGSSFFSKNKSAPGELSVKASSVSMGVRGTTFFVSYGVAKPDDVYMCVKKGVVAVKGQKDQQEVLVKEGQGVVISAGKETSNPKFLPWTRDLNWKLSPKEKDLVNKASIEESYKDILDKDYD